MKALHLIAVTSLLITQSAFARCTPDQIKEVIINHSPKFESCDIYSPSIEGTPGNTDSWRAEVDCGTDSYVVHLYMSAAGDEGSCHHGLFGWYDESKN